MDSYLKKILVGAGVMGALAFLAVWYFTGSYAGNSPGVGTRVALGLLCSGGGVVTGGLMFAVFMEKPEH